MKILTWVKQIIKIFTAKKKNTISIKGNTVYKEKDVMNIEMKGGHIKIENYHKKNFLGILGVILLLFLAIVIILNGNIVSKSSVWYNRTIRDDEEKSFQNKYVYGNYEGLILHNNDTTSFQKCDSEFYISTEERKKGNYIRTLVYQSRSYFLDAQNYKSEDEKWSYIQDTYESACIYLCTHYDSKYTKGEQDQWQYIKTETGVYLSTPFFEGEKNYVNSIVAERETNNEEAGFVLQKCLYFGDDNIIVVVLFHDGTYEDFMESNSESDLKLKRCFRSFYQVYKE